MARPLSACGPVTIGLVLLVSPAFAHAAAAAADAAKGEALFKMRCGACHAVVDDGTPHPGPLLKGVVGRKAASVAGFKGYSAALKASGRTWDRASLDQFLTLPSKLVPGTYMVVSIPDQTERGDVIAYLATLK
jgi:cytochrome c